jgi:hypothetical protein
MIVAWHEGPGTPPPQESRPVGYGVIRAGVLHRFEDWREEISNAVSLSRINWQLAMAYSAVGVSRAHSCTVRGSPHGELGGYNRD